MAARMSPRAAPSRSMAATVASMTPPSAPRQPACAAPITRALRVGEQNRAAIRRGHADGERAHAGDDGVGAGPRVGRPRRFGDDDIRRVDLIEREEAVRLDAERGRHAGAIFRDMRGIVLRAGAAIEARIEAARHAARAREEGVADAGQAPATALRASCRLRESGQRAELRGGDGDRLEQFAHAARAVRDQPRERDLDLGGLLGRRVRLQRRGALLRCRAAGTGRAGGSVRESARPCFRRIARALRSRRERSSRPCPARAADRYKNVRRRLAACRPGRTGHDRSR